MIDLEQLADEVMMEHEYRLDRPEDVPIRRNTFRHRQRPKTSIISEACELTRIRRTARETQ
jgi:hypothetical protein